MKSRLAARQEGPGKIGEPLAFPAPLKPHIQTAPDNFHYSSLAVLLKAVKVTFFPINKQSM